MAEKTTDGSHSEGLMILFFDAEINRWVKIISCSNTDIGKITELLCLSSAHSREMTSQVLPTGVTTQVPSTSGTAHLILTWEGRPMGTAYISSSAISGYNTTSAANKWWNTGTESFPQKNTLNDPCPIGYRVPTRTAWQGLISANTTINIGTWAVGATDGASNFSVAKVFKNNGNTVTFPGGGIVSMLQAHWSTVPPMEITRAVWENEILNTDAYFMSFFSLSRPYGFSVRCMIM